MLLSWDWHVLLLLKQLGKLLTTVEQLLSSSIQVRTELSEGSDLTVLSELEFE